MRGALSAAHLVIAGFVGGPHGKCIAVAFSQNNASRRLQPRHWRGVVGGRVALKDPCCGCCLQASRAQGILQHATKALP